MHFRTCLQNKQQFFSQLFCLSQLKCCHFVIRWHCIHFFLRLMWWCCHYGFTVLDDILSLCSHSSSTGSLLEALSLKINKQILFSEACAASNKGYIKENYMDSCWAGWSKHPNVKLSWCLSFTQEYQIIIIFFLQGGLK